MKKIIMLLIITVLLISIIYLIKNKVISPKEEVIQNNTPKEQLNIENSIPKDLKIISKNKGEYILEGYYKNLVYKIAIGKNLYPPGKCYLGDNGSYYNLKTGKSGEGWFSISSEEHTSGSFNQYNCFPEEQIMGYTIPVISSEHQDLYGDSSGPDHYMRRQTTLIKISTIKNNLYNQIYEFQNAKYSLDELDKYGNMLATIFSRRCLMPQYNGQNLLNVGPNSGGCSPVYWHNSKQNSEMAGMDPSTIDTKTRKAFSELLSNKGCKDDFVTKYLEDISNNKSKFIQEDFIKKLSCAGKISITRLESMRE